MRESPEVNAGSMADIAFLLLIFFLVTTTIETNLGVSTKLPPKVEDETPPPPIKEKNILEVLVNKNDQLMVDDKLMDVRDIRQVAIKFLDNGGGVGEESCSYCKGLKDLASSDNPFKAVISLTNDRQTSYKLYITVQNELVAAYNTLRDREANRLYPEEKNYVDMDRAYKDAATPESRKNVIKDKIRKIQSLFPRNLTEAETKKN